MPYQVLAPAVQMILTVWNLQNKAKTYMHAHLVEATILACNLYLPFIYSTEEYEGSRQNIWSSHAAF